MVCKLCLLVKNRLCDLYVLQSDQCSFCSPHFLESKGYVVWNKKKANGILSRPFTKLTLSLIHSREVKLKIAL